MSCKRSPLIRSADIAAGGTEDVTLADSTVEYTLRVVDAATLAGVAFSFAYATDPTTLFHFAAGESWADDRMVLSGPLTIRVGCTVAALVELLVWQA